MGIDVVNKRIFFAENHQKLLDTSEIEKPWVDEIRYQSEKMIIYSIFKRRRSKRGNSRGDGNPFIYALKQQKGYQMKCSEIVKIKPFFEHNLSVCLNALDFDCIVLSPSYYGITNFLASRILRVKPNISIYKGFFQKVKNADILQQIETNILPKVKDSSDRRFYTSLLHELTKYSDVSFSMKNIRPKYRKGLLVYKFSSCFDTQALKGKKALLIDDLLSTGTSLWAAKNLLERKNILSVQFLCLFSAL